ncbi:MAG TPA: hypothetical protein VM120_28555 [Bryobacteraceae bacterium]|nr:hypothetical protein [Bryobacteraceae bacterium]
MDSDRKYSQRGYQDSERSAPRDQKPKGPRPPVDLTGPRLPRMVQSVTATRCWSCSTALAADTDLKGSCPKCSSTLHCCKQCAHFEPSTRFQCLKPVPARIAYKDQLNECPLFSSRVTVARDAAHPPANGNGFTAPARIFESRSSGNARAAFDSLFKK